MPHCLVHILFAILFLATSAFSPFTSTTTAHLSPFHYFVSASSSLFILVFLNISKDILFLYLSFLLFLNLIAF